MRVVCSRARAYADRTEADRAAPVAAAGSGRVDTVIEKKAESSWAPLRCCRGKSRSGRLAVALFRLRDPAQALRAMIAESKKRYGKAA